MSSPFSSKDSLLTKSADGAIENTTGQLKANPPSFQLHASSESSPFQMKGSGGMPGDLTSGFAATTGHDLSNVNVHYNSNAPAQVGALAYAQGNDIHLGPGQEQHLAHEAAHVVQQREGRVQANNSIGDMPVNDSQSLESEADSMGAKAMQMKSAESPTQLKQSTAFGAIQRKVAQLKTVETDFGKFETTKFQGFNDRGVEAIIYFNPKEDNVNATKIGLTQTVKADKDGQMTAIDPNKESKRVKSGDGIGYAMDRVSEKNNPIYGAEDLEAGNGLDKTKEDNNTTGDPTEVGTNASYQLGHSFKDGENQKTKKAGLYDRPSAAKMKGMSKMFETAALAIEGTQTGKYYGSVKWGYSIDDAGLNLHDIELASKSEPTANFTEAAKLWNEGKTRGTLEVIGDPATVKSQDGTETTLVKGSKLVQKGTITWKNSQSVRAELKNEDGSMSGSEYIIKVVDLKDIGDGENTVDIPINEVRKTTDWVVQKLPSDFIGPPLSFAPDTKVRVHQHPSGASLGKIEALDGNFKGLQIEIDATEMAKVKY